MQLSSILSAIATPISGAEKHVEPDYTSDFMCFFSAKGGGEQATDLGQTPNNESTDMSLPPDGEVADGLFDDLEISAIDTANNSDATFDVPIADAEMLDAEKNSEIGEFESGDPIHSNASHLLPPAMRGHSSNTSNHQLAMQIDGGFQKTANNQIRIPLSDGLLSPEAPHGDMLSQPVFRLSNTAELPIASQTDPPSLSEFTATPSPLETAVILPQMVHPGYKAHNEQLVPTHTGLAPPASDHALLGIEPRVPLEKSEIVEEHTHFRGQAVPRTGAVPKTSTEAMVQTITPPLRTENHLHFSLESDLQRKTSGQVELMRGFNPLQNLQRPDSVVVSPIERGAPKHRLLSTFVPTIEAIARISAENSELNANPPSQVSDNAPKADDNRLTFAPSNEPIPSRTAAPSKPTHSAQDLTAAINLGQLTTESGVRPATPGPPSLDNPHQINDLHMDQRGASKAHAPQELGWFSQSNIANSVHSFRPAGTAQTPENSDYSRGIAEQISANLDKSQRSTFDLRLNPQELGRIRLAFVPHEGGAVLHIIAERPDTLDLMRRHIGQLQQDLRELGHDMLTLRFGSSPWGDQSFGQNANTQPTPSHSSTNSGDTNQLTQEQSLENSTLPVQLVENERLDLRL